MTEKCEQIHKQVDYRLDVHDKRLNDHSKRIDMIENINSRLEERISNLINQLNTLNVTLRWFMGLLIGAFVTFFFVAAQRGLL
jgi:hypothetical protein